MDFAQWARAEIARLRTEANSLEAALNRFLSSQHASTASVAAAGVPQAHIQDDERKPTKFGPILVAIRESGARGLSIDEMAKVADRHGISIGRAVLRSMIWHKKKKGELVPLPNGNYATKSG